MLLAATDAELPTTCRTWGTGGWLPPEQRETLDWLTLSRLLGWGVTMTQQAGSDFEVALASGNRWVIVAGNPERLGQGPVGLLASRLVAEPLLVVARAAARGTALATLAGVTRRPERLAGRALHWVGPGSPRRWSCRGALEASAIELSEESSIWATLDGAPLIAARRVGRGVVATLGFHPSRARDADGAATALLKHLLTSGAAGPVAWLDFEGSLILRMDDPGGAQNIHSRNWSYPKLGVADWTAVGTDLRRRGARMSIGYVAGWVDDGDAARGALKVAEHVTGRVPGQVYPSPLVKYRDLAGHAPGTLHDYEAEFRGIQALRAAGLADVELHGYTHMHPDSAAWARASDRYESWPATSWYRELGRAATAAIASRPPASHPLTLGVAAFSEYFDVQPTTLICPGDEWTPDVPERALDLGLQMVGSYYLAIRDSGRFCWTQHVCAPYLDQPDAVWFEAGLPVVGYFHDREVALEGVEWMTRWLDAWQDAGARKLMDFRELASAVGRRLYLEEHNGELCLTVASDDAPALVRHLAISIRVPEGRLPSHVSLLSGDTFRSLSVHSDGANCGRLILEPNQS